MHRRTIDCTPSAAAAYLHLSSVPSAAAHVPAVVGLAGSAPAAAGLGLLESVAELIMPPERHLADQSDACVKLPCQPLRGLFRLASCHVDMGRKLAVGWLDPLQGLRW